MESFNETLKRVEAQEMISRFRSKEDLYRYMTQHGNQIIVQHQAHIVGIFLPSMEGTKLAFLRAILCEQKKSFKVNEINHMEIPSYSEISVTNLYEDAMNDPEVAQYLPTREQLSNKLPERQFFFGILGTVRAEYLKDIIDEAHKKRYSLEPEEQKRQGILISDTWLEELKKHPYISKKPGTGIFLMKERAKLMRSRKSQTSHKVSKRLSDNRPQENEMFIDAGSGSKRRKMLPQAYIGDGQMQIRNPFHLDKAD